MHLPVSVVPVLESVVRSPVVAKGMPLEIWRSQDHHAWVDAFMELGSALFDSDIAEDGLPGGYALVAHLFDWEAQCQFSGWHALANRASTIDRVIASFDAVGLPGEAAALRRALSAWHSSDGDVDATSAAYAQERHAYSVDLDRLEYLAGYFIDNADRLFYVPDP